jgi:hypothetical protein
MNYFKLFSTLVMIVVIPAGVDSLKNFLAFEKINCFVQIGTLREKCLLLKMKSTNAKFLSAFTEILQV